MRQTLGRHRRATNPGPGGPRQGVRQTYTGTLIRGGAPGRRGPGAGSYKRTRPRPYNNCRYCVISCKFSNQSSCKTCAYTSQQDLSLRKLVNIVTACTLFTDLLIADQWLYVTGCILQGRKKALSKRPVSFDAMDNRHFKETWQRRAGRVLAKVFLHRSIYALKHDRST